MFGPGFDSLQLHNLSVINYYLGIAFFIVIGVSVSAHLLIIINQSILFASAGISE